MAPKTNNKKKDVVVEQDVPPIENEVEDEDDVVDEEDEDEDVDVVEEEKGIVPVDNKKKRIISDDDFKMKKNNMRLKYKKTFGISSARLKKFVRSCGATTIASDSIPIVQKHMATVLKKLMESAVFLKGKNTVTFQSDHIKSAWELMNSRSASNILFLNEKEASLQIVKKKRAPRTKKLDAIEN